MENARARTFLDDLTIAPVFQPIVDLLAVDVVGYEVLSREQSGELSPGAMFAGARKAGLSWELERICRAAAFERIARLPGDARTACFFLNVSPAVFEDERFAHGLALNELARHGITPSQVVVEITESHGIRDPARFERTLAMYARQGLRFAVDDFGSGHSSLLTLITCAPRFIKLDMGIVRDVHCHAYRRHLVRSLSAFAASVDARLVAEGVESWEELDTLMRLGVRYAQGFLLAKPCEQPPSIAEPVAARLRETVRCARSSLDASHEETLAPLVRPAVMIDPNEHRVFELDALFRHNPALDHVVLVEDARPVGLVTREDFAAKLVGPFGFALHQRNPATSVAQPTPLAVGVGTAVTTLARRAMDREPRHVYDPVIVLDEDGAVLGTITMKALIERSIELRVQTAQSANPLTGLPGNPSIQKWITRHAQTRTLDVVYADLDRFKEYNDHYGFLLGDEMIRLAARVLMRGLIADQADAYLGHVGGDDFVAVFPSGVSEEALERTCADLDAEKRTLFEAQDLKNGYLPVVNRRGELEQVPLVTMSLAVVRRANIDGVIHPAMLSQLAAMLKEKAKQKTATEACSGYVVERRLHSQRVRKATPLDSVTTLIEAPWLSTAERER